MSRFVAVSFLFMGWAFYEVSGGGDFQPRERAEPMQAESVPAAPATAAQVTASSLIPRPVMRPADLAADKPVESPLLQPLRIADTTNVAQDPDTLGALAQFTTLGASLAPGGSLFMQAGLTDSVQIASLGAGLASLTIQPGAEPETSTLVTETPGQDLREVTANAVNMRGGPGTGYPVIGRLTRGQDVEVLSDIGSGWLRLRDVANDKVGWIAASLISRKAP